MQSTMRSLLYCCSSTANIKRLDEWQAVIDPDASVMSLRYNARISPAVGAPEKAPALTGDRRMTRTLSPQSMAIVKATAPALQKHGVAITTRMYERLFVDPEIKALFDMAAQASGEQPKRLAAAILAFAQNVDKLDAITGAVDRIARRHVATHIRPEHYPAVANALLPAIADVLGDAATPEVLDAWGEAYWFLAEILIGREATLYGDVEAEAA